jgi:5-methylcytosine-specific restriction endonuclease McrA
VNPTRRLYSTSQWRRTRAVVLYRAGGLCEVRGPKCREIATTAHHVLPSSTHPHLFFVLSNLQAACGPCNYGGGRQVAVDNRTAHQLVEHLQQVVEEQREQIEELLAELARRDREEAGRDREEARPKRVPMIH